MMSHLGMEVSSKPEKPAPNPPFVAGMDFKNRAKAGMGFKNRAKIGMKWVCSKWVWIRGRVRVRVGYKHTHTRTRTQPMPIPDLF